MGKSAMTLAVICTGQGTLHPDMFLNLSRDAATNAILAQTELLAKVSLSELQHDANGIHSLSNEATQVLVVGHALASHETLIAQGSQADLYAGYSVGEMAAHACAGAWRPDEALALTLARAQCMDRALMGSEHPLCLSSLIGLSIDQCERLVAEHNCAIAIVNGPDHVVIGGTVDDVAEAEISAS